jgi:hypothetical protein
MFGNLDLNQLLQQLQQQLEEEKRKSYTASSGGGVVEVTLNGELEVTNLKIDPSLLEDKESLEILLITAINDAIKMAIEDKRASAFRLFGPLQPGGEK